MSEFPSSKEYVDHLFYNVCKQRCNFRVTHLYKQDDEQKGLKWKEYLDAQSDEAFMKKINNRTILDCEIVLDLDPDKDAATEDIKLQYNAIIKQLDEAKLSYKSFFSGSRGYHIHLLFPDLLNCDEELRKKIREKIISHFKCDLQKSSKNTMIALEYAPHWKTGKPKELLKETQGNNSLRVFPDVAKFLDEVKEKIEADNFKREILFKLKESVTGSHIYYGPFFADYNVLKDISRVHHQQTENLNFLVGEKTKIVGKITNKVYDYPIKISLCWFANRQTRDDYEENVFFMDEKYDARKWNKELEVSDEFWIYDMLVNKKKYWVFSQEELNLEEYTIEGMVVECDDFAKVGLNKRVRTIIPFLFVSQAKSRIIKYQSHKELFEDIKDLNLTEDNLFNFILSKDNGYSYRHPQYFERLIGAFLFSAKRTKGDYPLHLMIMAKQGTGKTYLEEALQLKMKEQQEIIEGSGITIKKLVPSFKDVIPEAGSFAKANRISIVDEFLRVLMRSRPEERENHLTMLNPLLEHKNREFGSGNCSITVKPTAKMLAVSNPVFKTHDMIQLCEKFDNSFISRILVFYQHKDHINWVQDEKGIQQHTVDIDHNQWISVYDYLQTFTCKYDKKRVNEIFTQFERFLADKVLDVYSRRYKQHHINLLMDGIIKLRCLTEQDVSFEANEDDYNTLLTIWRTMIIGWRGNNDISDLLSMQEKLRYLTREQNFIIEEIKSKGRIRDSDVYNLECQDPMFHFMNLYEIGILRKEGHYYYINNQAELGDYEDVL